MFLFLVPFTIRQQCIIYAPGIFHRTHLGHLCHTCENKKDWKSDDFQSFGVPKKGLEPSRLATHAPETCASTIPPLGHFANAKLAIFF